MNDDKAMTIDYKLGYADGIQDRLEDQRSKHPDNGGEGDVDIMEADAEYWDGYNQGYWYDYHKGWKPS